ncbi:DUF11 domain-containing protein, partial [Microbacterium sp. NPDC055665]
MTHDVPEQRCVSAAPPPNRDRKAREGSLRAQSRRVVAAFAASVLGTAVLLATPTSATAAELPLLSTPYVAVPEGEAAGYSTTLYTVSPDGSGYSPVGTVPYYYAALAGRTADGYLYAFAQSGPFLGQMLRINGDGVPTPLGFVPGMWGTATGQPTWNDDLDPTFQFALGGSFGEGADADTYYLQYLDVDGFVTTTVGIRFVDDVPEIAFTSPNAGYWGNDWSIRDGYVWTMQCGTGGVQRATLPDGTLQSFGGIGGDGNPLQPAAADQCERGVWHYPNGNIAGLSHNVDDASGSWTVIASVEQAASATPIINRVAWVPGAEVSAWSNAAIIAPPSAVEADLTIEKTATPNVQSNQEIEYELVVSNLSGSTSTSSVVSDTLPAGVTMSPSQVPNNCSLTDSFLSCNVGSLAVGASQSITYRVVAPTVSAPTTITNRVSVSGIETDPNLSNNQSQASTIVSDVPDNGNAAASAAADANGNPAAVAAGNADASTQASAAA